MLARQSEAHALDTSRTDSVGSTQSYLRRSWVRYPSPTPRPTQYERIVGPILTRRIAVIGAILQAAAVNVGMMIAGRLVAGYSCGMLLSVVPVYIAEISPPKQRGFIVGLQGMAIATGFCLANWIGYGGSFAIGDAQWRITLSMQAPAAVALSVGAFFVPFSPRWRKHRP